MKVSQEVAQKEIDSWLDFKKVKAEKRTEKDKAKQIQDLVDLVSAGDLVLDKETKEFTHTLLFPIENELKTTVLKYAPRVNVAKVQKNMVGVKGDDLHGMILAYGAAITGQPKGLLKELDSEDYRILQAVAVFFM
jgi:hypothetical protein